MQFKRIIAEMVALQRRMMDAVGVSMQDLHEKYGVPEVGCDPRTLRKKLEKNESELVCMIHNCCCYSSYVSRIIHVIATVYGYVSLLTCVCAPPPAVGTSAGACPQLFRSPSTPAIPPCTRGAAQHHDGGPYWGCSSSCQQRGVLRFKLPLKIVTLRALRVLSSASFPSSSLARIAYAVLCCTQARRWKTCACILLMQRRASLWGAALPRRCTSLERSRLARLSCF